MNQPRDLRRITPEFTYHLLRSALDGFSKNLSQLDQGAYEDVYRRANRSFDIESLVLASPEAGEVVISAQQLEQSVQAVASRYDSNGEFLQDLQENGLDEEGLRRALYRELLFDHVMQRVAASSADVSDLDVRLFYEMHSDRFETPEQRVASHILITINPEFPENTRDAAAARMDDVVARLDGRVNRFYDFARRYSECPTAMEGGRLGDVKRGQLYAELDAMLFAMEEQRISPVIESEIGLHVLYCEKIRPARRPPFSRVAPRIREFMQERQRRNCQKAWLASLRKANCNEGAQ